jgi:hypothetical protein
MNKRGGILLTFYEWEGIYTIILGILLPHAPKE